MPLALACWFGSWIGTGTRPWEVAIGATVALALVAWRFRLPWLALALLVLIVTAVTSGMRSWHLHQGPVAELARQHGAATALLRLDGEPSTVVRGGRPMVVARAIMQRLETGERTLIQEVPLLLLASGDAAAALTALAPGALHEVSGRMAAAEPSEPIAARLRVTSVSAQLRPPGLLDRAVTGVHAGLWAATAHSPPEQAALVPSLVVGDRSRITPELNSAFRATALSHLLAVSGSNLTLMVGALLTVAKTLGVRGWWIRGVAAIGVAGFVLVCRAEPSVLRAAAMGLVALSALGLGRDRRSLRNLSLAVLVLLPLDPYLSRSWGFALSAAACLGITLWGEPWTEAMARWAPRWLAEAIAVPLAAQISTMPLVAAMAGQLSVVGVFANALAGPFVGPATVLGLVAAVTSWLLPVATLAAWCAGWTVQPILWVAQFGAAAPHAAVVVPSGLVGALAGGLLGAVIVVLADRAIGRRWVSVGLAVVLMVGAWLRVTPPGWPGPWQVVFCDVGQGDATVLRVADDAAVLVDTGPEPGATLDCLAAAGVVRLAGLVLTHYHADHVGGAEAVIERYRPPLVVVSPLASPPWVAEGIAAAAHRAGSRLLVAEPGQRFAVGQLTWTTVSARSAKVVTADGEGESTAENDSSIVAVAEIGELRVLLPGDAEPEGQRSALQAARRLGGDVRAHILKLPHHGSARQDPGFLAASGAELAVVSAGEGNPYGHPASKTLDLAVAHGMAVARTDEQGHLAVALAEGRLVVRSWHDR